MPGPLHGIHVVDLTRALSGPYCTMMLGDMGADVLKIEHPDGGDETRQWGPPFQNGESSYYLSINRNKRSAVMDLKSDSGLETLSRLIEAADVLVENFRPGTMERLGLGYEAAHSINPSLVYCSISGFGQTGPRRTEPAYDGIVQGMSGIHGLTGDPDGIPMRPGVPIADITTGMFAAYAIATALYARERDPQHAGQWIDTSMLGSQVALLTYQAGRYFATGVAPKRLGNKHSQIAPYEMYPTADGFVNVACGNESLWRRFCVALDLPSLIEDERFTDNARRLANRIALAAEIEPALISRTTEEVVTLLEHAGVPGGAVLDLAGVFADPQAQHLNLAQPTPHPTIPDLRTTGFPYRLSATPAAIRLHPPGLGEHTRDFVSDFAAHGPPDVEPPNAQTNA